MAEVPINSSEPRRDSELKTRLPEADVGESEMENANEMTELIETFVSPRFVIPPKDTFILSNQTGKIEARIYSVPKPIVRWYQNGQLITNSLFPKIKKYHCEPETYVLEVTEATASDMGSYTCVARNCHGSISASATLRITDLETEECPRFLERLKRTEILADTNGRIELKITGAPRPKVEWSKNLLPLKENNRIKFSHREPHSYVLHLNNAEPEDTGLYTCQASNDSGTISTTAAVYVEDTEYFNKKWSQDLALFKVKRRQCPNGWSQRELDDYLYRQSIANYQIKYRAPCGGYINLF